MYVNGWLLFGGMGLVLFGLAWLALNGRDTAASIDQIGDDLDRSVRGIHQRFEDADRRIDQRFGETDRRIDRGEGWTLHLIDDYRARVAGEPLTEPIPITQPATEPMSKVLIGHWGDGAIDPGVVGPMEPWPRDDPESYGRHAHRVEVDEEATA